MKEAKNSKTKTISSRTKLTKEEVRDMFPLEALATFKKFKCFDKLLDEITYSTNSSSLELEQKVVLLSKTLNFNPAELLLRAFDWKKSINSYDYWSNIYHKLI